jgi:hypothetical protein
MSEADPFLMANLRLRLTGLPMVPAAGISSQHL